MRCCFPCQSFPQLFVFWQLDWMNSLVTLITRVGRSCKPFNVRVYTAMNEHGDTALLIGLQGGGFLPIQFGTAHLSALKNKLEEALDFDQSEETQLATIQVKMMGSRGYLGWQPRVGNTLAEIEFSKG